MAKSKGKNMRPVTMDILSGIYQSTLHVGSGHTTQAEEFYNQTQMARKLIKKHGVSGVLAGFFYAFLTMSREEVVLQPTDTNAGVRTGRIPLKVGEDRFQLYPYFKGLDAYMYDRWPSQMESVKMKVCNEMLITPEWGMMFLNFPYDPDRPYLIDEAAVEDLIKPEIDLSGMPETEEKDV